MRSIKRKLLTFFMLAVMLAGAVPIQAKVITNHDMYGELNTASQRKAYKAYTTYLKKGAKGKKYKKYQSLYKGKLSQKDLDELVGIIADEYYGIYGTCKITYYNRGGNLRELAAVPSRDIGTYKKNLKYTKIIQKKAQSITKGAKSQKEKSDIIQNWIVNHVSYHTAKVDGLNPGDGWCAYKKGKALCEGYAQLYKCMCNAAGINCRVMVGYGESEGNWENHEWNVVKINGVWYYSDITFLDAAEDPVYRYSRTLWSDHRWSSDFYRE